MSDELHHRTGGPFTETATNSHRAGGPPPGEVVQPPLTGWRRQVWRVLGAPPSTLPSNPQPLEATFDPVHEGSLGGATNGASTLASTGMDRRTVPGWQRRLWLRLSRRPAIGFLVGCVLALLFAVGGLASVLHGSTTYTSRTVMLIDDPLRLATAGDDGQLVKLSALRYKYAALMTTTTMTVPIAQHLHLPVGRVAGSVSVSIPAQSLLLDVNGSAPSARQAESLSKAGATEISNYVQSEDATYGIPLSNRFTISVVDPTTPASSSGPSIRHDATVAIGFGVLGWLLGFAGTQLVRNRSLGH